VNPGSQPCGADGIYLGGGVLTLILEHAEPWDAAAPTNAIMKRVSSFFDCIDAGEAASFAPTAKSVRILIRYRDDPPPDEAERAFRKLREDALTTHKVVVAWEPFNPYEPEATS
jgi:hypothetical protein